MPLRDLAIIPLLALALSQVGCSSAPAQVQQVAHPGVVPPGQPLEQVDGSPFDLHHLQPLPATVPLIAVNDDMRAFLRANVPDNVSKQRKVELILQAILTDGLHLNYNNFKTYTAEEAFYAREGNCLSFTNLFVALAREAGVNAWYQEVAVPPTWSSQGDTWLYNLHINAVVKLPGAEQVIDFNIDAYDTELQRRKLSDTEVLARYHSNMGVHWMSERDHARAFQHFREAIALRPNTAYFWTNLGTLYRRVDAAPLAEAAFLRAIDIADEPTAMSNLARLYRAAGRLSLAQQYEARVQLYRRKNPYYLFYLAEEAYAAAEYSQAQRLLTQAIRKHQGEHEFYRLLGLSQLQLGELEQAKRSFRRARRIAESDDRERYSSKLRMLAGP